MMSASSTKKPKNSTNVNHFGTKKIEIGLSKRAQIPHGRGRLRPVLPLPIDQLAHQARTQEGWPPIDAGGWEVFAEVFF